MKSFVILLVLFFLSQYAIQAQHSVPGLDFYCSFINPTEEDGVFLGTLYGAFQFDGHNFEKINLGKFSNDNIQSEIYQDQDKRLWLSIYEGLLEVRSDTSILHQIIGDEKLFSADYYAFHCDEKYLWFLHRNELRKFNLTKKKEESFSAILETINGRRVEVFKSKNQDKENLFCSYYFTDKPSVTRYYEKNDSLGKTSHWENWPEKIMANDVEHYHNELVYATDYGLYYGNIGESTLLSINKMNYFVDDEKKQIQVDAVLHCNGNSWLLNIHDQGIVIAKKEKGDFYFSELLLSKNKYGSVNKMVKDDSGNVFFSTTKKSLVFQNLDNRKFKNIPFEEVIDPFEIFLDNQDRLWIGNNQGAAALDYESSKNKYLNNSSLDRIYSLPQVKYHAVFENHLFLINKQYQCSYYDLNIGGKPLFNFKENIYGTYKTLNPNKFWLTTLDGNLFEFNSSTNTVTNNYLPDSLSHSTFSFVKAIDGNHFFASENNQKILFFKKDESITIDGQLNFSAEIHDAYINEGSIWITTNKGLFAIDKVSREISAISNQYRELGSYLSAIIEQEKGESILIAGNSAIYQYTFKDSSLIIFTEKDGYVPSFYLDEDIRDSKGAKYLPHKTGLLEILDLSNDIDSKEAIPMRLSQFKINDHKEVPILSSGMNLSFNENTISFVFNAFDFVGPKDVKFKYRLKSYEMDWVNAESSKEFLRYAKIPPGEYTMEFKVTNAFGYENDSSVQLPITISPPFWQTWWFRLLALAALGLIAYRSFRTYVGQKLRRKNLLLREQRLIIEKKEAVENERSRIAAEMHDDLGGGLTTIKFLSQKALKNIKDEKQAKDIGKIGKYSTQLVQNLSEIIWAMNGQFDSLEGLLAYVRNYAHEFLEDNQMELNFPYLENIPKQSISGEKRRNVFLVIKEALNNAVRHSGADQVRIVVRCEKELIIRIMDNGVGLPDNIREHGNGLSNMTKRMQRIGGNCTFKPMDGLCVELTLPLSKN